MPMDGTNTTHTLQERYSSLVLAKIRQELVLKDGVIFNNDYEGSPKAGAVKIPVRDTEVAVSDYDKANGITAGTGGTAYETMTIDKDKGVNEIIDGYLTNTSAVRETKGTRSAAAATPAAPVVQNIYAQKQSPAQMLREAKFLQERAVLIGV